MLGNRLRALALHARRFCQSTSEVGEITSGRRVPLWLGASQQLPKFPSLQSDARTDVCVIGAGIAGLSTAYSLLRRGHKVIVLEDGQIASGESGRTTAHLSNAFDDRYYEMEKMHGLDAARVLAASHTAAIDALEETARREHIQCDFRRIDGYLIKGAPDEPDDVLREECLAAERAGLADVRFVQQSPFAPFYDSGPSVVFPRQGQFHPVKYLGGLAEAIRRLGGQIYTDTHAQQFEGGTPAIVKTAAGPIVTAKAIVVATNTPVNDRVVMHTKQSPYRTYVVALRVPRGSFPAQLVWDTLHPYHYVRTQPLDSDWDALIVGGEDEHTGRHGDMIHRYSMLEEWIRWRFPKCEDVIYRWSGQVLEPADAVAFIGRNPRDKENVFVATGDSGNGMTHGAVAGLLLPDLIEGRANSWAPLYDPGRKPLHAPKEWFSEAVQMNAQYLQWLQSKDNEVNSEAYIPRGQGRIMRVGLTKHALYRDNDGKLHEMSAVCPHLLGIVSWNNDEKTWDCPCHGSRFAATGEVINGPANHGLKRVEVREESERVEEPRVNAAEFPSDRLP